MITSPSEMVFEIERFARSPFGYRSQHHMQSKEQSLATGYLYWGTEGYHAWSGPWNRGSLPRGEYTVRTQNVVSGPHLQPAYHDKLSTVAFFIPIQANFPTSRTGMGIHPDGNVAGSEGCIVLDTRAESFWKRWISLPLAQRPTKLVVQVHPTAWRPMRVYREPEFLR